MAINNLALEVRGSADWLHEHSRVVEGNPKWRLMIRSKPRSARAEIRTK